MLTSNSPSTESFEEAKRYHQPVIDTMHALGYGLMLDGDTFYTLGYELDPLLSVTFTMRQAYSIVNAHETRAEQTANKQVVEAERQLVKGLIAPVGDANPTEHQVADRVYEANFQLQSTPPKPKADAGEER